jgi:hypothetical protein
VVFRLSYANDDFGWQAVDRVGAKQPIPSATTSDSGTAPIALGDRLIGTEYS